MAIAERCSAAGPRRAERRDARSPTRTVGGPVAPGVRTDREMPVAHIAVSGAPDGPTDDLIGAAAVAPERLAKRRAEGEVRLER
jgi:hypothetical protein